MNPIFAVIDLGTLPGGTMSKAYALNNCGQVVGMGGYPGSGFLWAAWLWQEGRLSALSMPNEGLAGVAMDIHA